MNREDIIKLARDISNTPHDAHTTPDLFGENQIVKFFQVAYAAGAAAEREACAKLVDYWEARQGEHSDAIRARGQA